MTTMFIIECAAAGCPEDSSSVILSAESYEAAVDVLLGTFVAAFGSLDESWNIYAVTAQEYPSASSPVRRRKGYSKIYLADSDLTGDPVAVHDAVASPRSGVEFLYGIVSGPARVAAQIARLGLWSEASALICSRDSQTPEALKHATESATSVTPTDAVRWDLQKLFHNTPSALGVAGLLAPPIGLLRVGVCARDDLKRSLIEQLSHAARSASANP